MSRNRARSPAFLVVAIAVALAPGTTLVAGCSQPADSSGSALPAGAASTGTSTSSSATTTDPTTMPTPVPTTTVAATVVPTTAAPAPAPVAVGTRRVTINDEVRGRSLDTLVHYPARVDGTATAAIDRPFPLALMAHGYRLPADGYERMLIALARRGFVVAAPDFPHTSSNGGDGNRGDIVNQPADLVAVLDAVVGGSVPGLPPIAHPDRVAVMGHSDGGLTASALAYNTQFRDPRIAAAVVMTGGRALFPGSYFATGSPPLLAVHGTADETNPIRASESLFRELPPGIPGYFVRVDGGTHLGPFMFGTGMPEVGDVLADFLAAHLRPTVDAAAVARLHVDGNRPPLSIETR